MTASRPSIDAEGMCRARELMAGASADFFARLVRTNSEVIALRSTWTGAAAEDFGDAMREWEKHVTTVIDELNQMVASLRTGT